MTTDSCTFALKINDLDLSFTRLIAEIKKNPDSSSVAGLLALHIYVYDFLRFFKVFLETLSLSPPDVLSTSFELAIAKFDELRFL